MRKLVEWTFVSLDGVIDSPDKWARPYLDDEHHQYARALLDEADALLLGRKTYEGFLDFWPKQTGEIADRLNERPKYVASRTLTPGKPAGTRQSSRAASPMLLPVSRRSPDGTSSSSAPASSTGRYWSGDC